MTPEEKIKEELENKFDFLKDKSTISRQRRIFLEVPLEKVGEVFAFLFNTLQFRCLSAITGLDEGDALAVIYHLTREGSIVLNLRVRLSRDNPAVKTVTNYFPAADSYEREMMDLLGIKVEGLAPGHRYPLPDGWPQNDFPLRKDWKGTADKIKGEVKNA